jgi:hypothetical protein
MNFDIPITENEYGPIRCPVSARFIHSHRITKASVTDVWAGILDCVWWKGDRSWHINFTRTATPITED